MPNLILNGFVGLSVGNGYAIVKDREDDIRQGGNYYLSGMCQFSQACQWTVLVHKINHAFAAHAFKGMVDLLCNIVPLVLFPITQFWAAVKQGDYPLAQRYSVILSKGFSFLAVHAGDMIRIAMVVSSLALMALGQVAYGGAVLVALAYEAVDRMGFVPRKISLFMETYMPTLSLVGNLIGGTVIVRLASAFMLPTHIHLAVSTWLLHKVDRVVRLIFRLPGPLLSDFDGPVEVKKEMTRDEIIEVLNSKEDAYVINPAHCSKPVEVKLPNCFEFDQFLILFDKIEWVSKKDLLEKKLKDDDRFIDFFLKNHPQETKEVLKENIGKLPGAFLTGWIREQLQQFVSLLNGEKRVMGLQQDLEHAIDDCSKILPYLLHLPKNSIELEDALLKLAIEGGDYCGRGIKRVSNEVLRGILQNDIWENIDKINPTPDFERKLQQSLQNQRMKIMQRIHLEQARKLKIPDFLSHDTYGFDLYRLYFSLGFYPLSPNERYRIGFSELLFWEIYSSYRVQMLEEYRHSVDDALKDVLERERDGDKKEILKSYVKAIITENPRLSDADRQEILALYAKDPAPFRRLLFVRLGVFKHFMP